jgi:hypothetical protein
MQFLSMASKQGPQLYPLRFRIRLQLQGRWRMVDWEKLPQERPNWDGMAG